MQPDYSIRSARRSELIALPEIERLAAAMFAPFGLAELFARDVVSIELLQQRQRAGQLWVAVADDVAPIGFAIVSEVGDNAHLDGINVRPDHGRRGVGTALVEAACTWAMAADYRAMTLSTMRHVPWNAPFYKKLGFEIIGDDELTEALCELRKAEERMGVPMHDRVVMRRDLDGRAGL